MRFTIPTNEVTVPPKVEPVGVEDVKSAAQIVDDDFDNNFIRTELIPPARDAVEKLAVRSLITQTRKQYYDDMPCSPVRLRYGPVQSILAFTYTDTNEAEQTLASTYYDVDTKRIPGRVLVAYQQTWPAALRKSNSVSFTYVAGYGATPDSVPRQYRRAILVLCTHWYYNRDQLGCVSDEMTGKLLDIIAIEGRTLEYA